MKRIEWRAQDGFFGAQAVSDKNADGLAEIFKKDGCEVTITEAELAECGCHYHAEDDIPCPHDRALNDC